MNSLWKAASIVLIVLGIALPLSFSPTASAHQMNRFSSYSDLMNFVQSKPSVCPETSTTPNLPSRGIVTPPPGPSMISVNSAGSTDHSQTNVQVQGVDELDTVKTDGQYIYTISNNTLIIVKAYPTDHATVVSKVDPNASLTGVFISGNKLVLIGGESSYWPEPLMGASSGTTVATGMMPVKYYRSMTRAWVYDITSPSNPVLNVSLQQSGSYEGSRLISSSIYLITTENLFIQNGNVNLPTRIVNGQNATVLPAEIYHSDVQDYYYSFTNVVQLDLAGPPKITSETFLISASSTIYASTENIYLTSTTWACTQETVIHRIKIGSGAVDYEATGAVPGTVMNQFSMDEYQGFFRVATSTWQRGPMTSSPTVAPRWSPLQGLTTNIYVLNMDLRLVGRIEGLAPGEQFHSARFFGDRGYLVTFKKTDPLFVLDLSNPRTPRVLGELHVAGYSDYLQPYDETHLIGIGKNATDAAMGSFAWYQGVKVSLFDVSDPTTPVEVSNYVIGDRGTTSQALTDSHAVLFDHNRNLLVIPVEVAKLPENNVEPWAWGAFVWQGAYVFNVSPQGGLVFKGGITHLQNGEVPGWSNTSHFVSRSLYIGSVLYTVSPAMLKINSLTDLTELGTITL